MQFIEFIRKRGNQFPFNITVVDVSQADQPLIYVNESFCRLTGYSDDEVLGQNCRFLQNGKANPKTISKIRDAIKSSQPICCDILNFKKNGMQFYNRLVLIPINGESESFLGLQHEIPEEKFEKFNQPDNLEILDKTLNPLTVLVLSDMISDEEYKNHFEQANKRLRDFILNLP